MNKTVVVDTGYWFALLDPRDGRYKEAQPKADYIDSMTVVIPWPVLYETVNTRFVKNRLSMDNFGRIVKRSNTRQIDDAPYRNYALTEAFREALEGRRSISLCNVVIRMMLLDIDLKIHALLTFNPGDFADVCRNRRIEML